MLDALKCLNSEWQGCENPILQEGATKLAQELFRHDEFLKIDDSSQQSLEKQDGVFALNTIGQRFLYVLKTLENLAPEKIMTVGGSCGTEAAPVAYLNKLYKGNLAVVWFDAHGDLNTPKSSPSGHFHGMVLRTLLGEGPDVFCKQMDRPIVSKQVFLAGVRDLDEAEQEYINSSDITISDVNKKLTDQILSSGFQKAYIHIDVDVFNPNDFSDALMPTKGGPTRSELTDCLSMISNQLDIVGVGIVEFCGEKQETAKQLYKILKDIGITKRCSRPGG